MDVHKLKRPSKDASSLPNVVEDESSSYRQMDINSLETSNLSKVVRK